MGRAAARFQAMLDQHFKPKFIWCAAHLPEKIGCARCAWAVCGCRRGRQAQARRGESRPGTELEVIPVVLIIDAPAVALAVAWIAN